MSETHFICTICPTPQTILKSHLQWHYRTVHKWKNAYKCYRCEDVFQFPDDFSEHLSSKHDIKVFMCHICHTPFTKKYNMERHVKAHSRENPRYSKIEKITDSDGSEGINDSAFTSPTFSESEHSLGAMDHSEGPTATMELFETSGKGQLLPIITQFVQCSECPWKSTIYKDIQKHFQFHYGLFMDRIESLEQTNKSILKDQEKMRNEIQQIKDQLHKALNASQSGNVELENYKQLIENDKIKIAMLNAEITSKDVDITKLRKEINDTKDKCQALKLSLDYSSPAQGTSKQSPNPAYVPSLELYDDSDDDDEDPTVSCSCSSSKSPEPFYTQLGAAQT